MYYILPIIRAFMIQQISFCILLYLCVCPCVLIPANKHSYYYYYYYYYSCGSIDPEG